jgi:hypothetical protein
MESIEKTLEKLNNVLSHKQIETFEIVGTCDKNGQIIAELPGQMEFKEDSTYYVSLIGLTGTSFFPNVTDSNNKFYYSGKDNKIIELTIPTGAYDIADYNEFICMSIPKVENADPITISLHKPTGKVVIKLAAGFKVYFDKDKKNSFSEELGFEKKVLSEAENLSPNMADIVKVQKVHISCDICRGAYLNGKGTNIIFSFPNEKRYGSPLSLVPTKRQYKQLIKKSFNKITFAFTDERGHPVDFQGAVTTVSLEVKQM